MAIQLNPSKVPVWKSESQLRLGIGESAQELGDVTNAQERLIHLLFEGVAENQISLVGNSVGLSNQETADLIQRLTPSLVSTSQDLGRKTLTNVRLAELMRIGLLADKSPAEVVAKRITKTIEVSKLDRTGLMTIRALSEVGFRNFVTKDYALVGRSDLGELGYSTKQHGTSRINAARELLETETQKIEINQASEASSKKAICIVSGMHRLLPSEHTLEKRPIVLIEYRLDSIFVSRVIQLGQDPCLSCRDLWKSDSEPTWTAESIQLAARNDHLDDGVNLLLACSIAVRNVCAYVDTNQGINTFVSLKDRGMREENWLPHETCGCLKF